MLTDWLHEKLQELADLDKEGQPLTFGMLKTKGITLKVVTTNLSHGQPYALPFDDKAWIFHEDEMRCLFPKRVIEHLIAKAQHGDRVSLEKLPGYHYLPEPADLPVVVAMRMSLSFPVLICAIPLHAVRLSAHRELKKAGITVPQNAATDLERNWFSDGGISSNFPIHFFDDWLPTCPTFGINLRSMPPEESRAHVENLAVPAAPGRRPRVKTTLNGQVFLPGPNAPQSAEFKPLTKLADFLAAIWNTAQNYRDNTQAMLPSYRERIVNVRFSDDEGGLNLTMGEQKVKNVQAKGKAAGEMLRDDFNLTIHQWVRFQVLMPQLERNLKEMKGVLISEAYQDLLGPAEEAAPQEDDVFPYERSTGWREDARKRVAGLLKLVEDWEAFDREWVKDHPDWAEECFFPYKCPRPQPVLRVSPKL